MGDEPNFLSETVVIREAHADLSDEQYEVLKADACRSFVGFAVKQYEVIGDGMM